METKYLKINTADNVAVAIVALPAGEKLIVDGKEIILNEDVPAGHKFALKDFTEGFSLVLLFPSPPSVLALSRVSSKTGPFA